MNIDATELKRRFLLRVKGVRDKKIYIGPEDLAFEINNACNLTCKYCWFHAPGSPRHFEKARYFPWEKFVEAVSDAVELEVDHITITGSGEPTMHPQFREMMRHLEIKPLNVKVLTNATFPLEYCDDVIRGDSVLIDLSAVERQQYLDLQGKDLFERVVHNIERLVSLRDSIKPEFLVDIVYIVNSDNVDQIPKMKELASRLGVNHVKYDKMNVHEYNRSITLPDGPDPVLAGERKRTPPVCLNGWFYMVIKPEDDNASTCCHIPKMRLGEFDPWSFKQLWLSQQSMNMRLLGKYGQIQKMHKACQTCPFYDRNMRWAKVSSEIEENAKAAA